MKKNYTLCFFLILCDFVGAQAIEQKYLLSTNTNNYALSNLDLLDPYLSPLVYNGLGLSYNHEDNRFLSIQNNSLSVYYKFDLVGGFTLNPTNTASMMYAGINSEYGMFQHFQPINGLRLMAGGSWDVDFGWKMIARNINNPVNIDLATNFNLSGRAKYDVQLFKRVFGLQLSVQTPMIGCMFVPREGASYYEMFDLWNLDNTLHFSSLHNKRGIKGDISCTVPFRRFTLYVGVKYNELKYTANDMVFKRNELSLLIGSRFDMIKFSGKNNKAPNNFISTNK